MKELAIYFLSAWVMLSSIVVNVSADSRDVSYPLKDSIVLVQDKETPKEEKRRLMKGAPKIDLDYTRRGEENKITLDLNEKEFTLSFDGKSVSKNTITQTLEKKYNIVVIPHRHSGIDKETVSDSFKNLPLETAFNKLFGENRYHFSIRGEDKELPSRFKEPEAQPENPPVDDKQLPTMIEAKPEIPELNQHGRVGPKMIDANKIKPLDSRSDVKGGMKTVTSIKPVSTKKVQVDRKKAPKQPGYHLRLQLECKGLNIIPRQVKLSAGNIKAKQAIVGDFVVALVEGEKIRYLMTRQNPFLEHPFHHEKDIRGNNAEGPIRISEDGTCTPFTILIPVNQSIAKQTINFYEYTPKPGAKIPLSLNEKTFSRWKEYLSPRGSLSGEEILHMLKKTEHTTDINHLDLSK